VRPHAGSGGGGLATGVATADNDDVIALARHGTEWQGWLFIAWRSVGSRRGGEKCSAPYWSQSKR
jgi:hypothetical protein